MHTQVIRMLDGTHETIELDLHTATPADVQSFVDARYEAAWRATVVRVLRRDLPFIGPTLRTSSYGFLLFTKTLAENGVGKNTTLHTYWPPNHGTQRDRERCGIGEPCNEADGGMVKRAPRDENKKVQEAEKPAQGRAAELAVRVNAANEVDVRVEGEGQAIDMNEEGEEEEEGPEQGEGRSVEDNRAEQVEEGRRELVYWDMEGPVDSVPQSEEDPFRTFDENKENWDPRIVQANLFWQSQFGV